jgi:hypothetical protein
MSKSRVAYNIDDVLRILRGACASAGSQRAWAEKHGLSAAYVSDVLKGRRNPGPAICKPLRLLEVTIYQEI